MHPQHAPPPPGAYHGYLTPSLSPGVGKPLRGWGIWHQAAEGAWGIWPFVHDEWRENVKRFRPGSNVELHMSRTQCKWAKAIVWADLHWVRLMWSSTFDLGLSGQDIAFLAEWLTKNGPYKLRDAFECKYEVPLSNFNLKRSSVTYSVLFQKRSCPVNA